MIYRYEGTFIRSLLAAIDHNHNLHRKQARNAKGKLIFSRRWSKRAKRWKLITVKEKKDYAYLPILCANASKALSMQSGENTTYEHDPVKIAPTIASLPAPPTSLLVEEHKTRF